MTLLLSATFTFFGTLNKVVYTGFLAHCDFLQNLFYVWITQIFIYHTDTKKNLAFKILGLNCVHPSPFWHLTPKYWDLANKQRIWFRTWFGSLTSERNSQLLGLIPNCWDSWSKFMKSSASSWVLYSFCWLPIVGSFLLIYGNPFWTFIHSLLTIRPIVHVSRISGQSLNCSIFQFLGCWQPHNLVIVVIIVVVAQIIINYNLKSIVSLYHTCFR